MILLAGQATRAAAAALCRVVNSGRRPVTETLFRIYFILCQRKKRRRDNIVKELFPLWIINLIHGKRSPASVRCRRGRPSGVPAIDAVTTRRCADEEFFPMPRNPVACPDCDLLQNVPRLPPQGKARCRRCGRVLAVSRPGANDRTLALALGAALVFVLANSFPLMGLQAAGREVDTTIIGGAWMMWREGQQATAALVAICAVIAPALYIAFAIVVLYVSRRRQTVPAWVGVLLQWAETAHEWSMAEVMMLGILVALVKIADLATVVMGVGIFATGALIVLVTLVAVNFEPDEIWERTQWVVAGETVTDKTAAVAGDQGGGE